MLFSLFECGTDLDWNSIQKMLVFISTKFSANVKNAQLNCLYLFNNKKTVDYGRYINNIIIHIM